MSWIIQTTPLFERRLARFLRKHPDLRERFAATVDRLREDPTQPSLRLHALSGEFDGLHAVSLTYAYRIVLAMLIEGQTITLIDIGSHDEVYR